MRHGPEVLAQERFALGSEAGAELGHDDAGFDAGLPGFETRDMLFDDGFGARHFGFAGALVLLHDFGKIVDAVEIDVVEAGGGRVHVARDAQIDEQKRTVGARGHGAFEHAARKNVLGTRDRADDGIGPFERGFESVPVHDFGAHAVGHFAGALGRTVSNAQRGDAAVAQMTDDLLASRAGAQDQRRMALKTAEDSLGKLYSGIGDRDRARTDIGLGADALADFEAL